MKKPVLDTKIKVKVTFLFLTELKCIGVKCNVDGDVTNRYALILSVGMELSPLIIFAEYN